MLTLGVAVPSAYAWHAHLRIKKINLGGPSTDVFKFKIEKTPNLYEDIWDDGDKLFELQGAPSPPDPGTTTTARRHTRRAPTWRTSATCGPATTTASRTGSATRSPSSAPSTSPLSDYTTTARARSTAATRGPRTTPITAQYGQWSYTGGVTDGKTHVATSVALVERQRYVTLCTFINRYRARVRVKKTFTDPITAQPSVSAEINGVIRNRADAGRERRSTPPTDARARREHRVGQGARRPRRSDVAGDRRRARRRRRGPGVTSLYDTTIDCGAGITATRDAQTASWTLGGIQPGPGRDLHDPQRAQVASRRQDAATRRRPRSAADTDAAELHTPPLEPPRRANSRRRPQASQRHRDGRDTPACRGAPERNRRLRDGALRQRIDHRLAGQARDVLRQRAQDVERSRGPTQARRTACATAPRASRTAATRSARASSSRRRARPRRGTTACSSAAARDGPWRRRSPGEDATPRRAIESRAADRVDRVCAAARLGGRGARGAGAQRRRCLLLRQPRSRRTAPHQGPCARAKLRRLSNERTLSRWAHPANLADIYSRHSGKSRVVGRLRFFTEDGFPEVYLLLVAVDERRRQGVGPHPDPEAPQRPQGLGPARGARALQRRPHAARRQPHDAARDALQARAQDLVGARRGRRARRRRRRPGKFWIREKFRFKDRRSTAPTRSAPPRTRRRSATGRTAASWACTGPTSRG